MIDKPFMGNIDFNTRVFGNNDFLNSDKRTFSVISGTAKDLARIYDAPSAQNTAANRLKDIQDEYLDRVDIFVPKLESMEHIPDDHDFDEYPVKRNDKYDWESLYDSDEEYRTRVDNIEQSIEDDYNKYMKTLNESDRWFAKMTGDMGAYMTDPKAIGIMSVSLLLPSFGITSTLGRVAMVATENILLESSMSQGRVPHAQTLNPDYDYGNLVLEVFAAGALPAGIVGMGHGIKALSGMLASPASKTGAAKLKLYEEGKLNLTPDQLQIAKLEASMPDGVSSAAVLRALSTGEQIDTPNGPKSLSELSGVSDSKWSRGQNDNIWAHSTEENKWVRDPDNTTPDNKWGRNPNGTSSKPLNQTDPSNQINTTRVDTDITETPHIYVDENGVSRMSEYDGLHSDGVPIRNDDDAISLFRKSELTQDYADELVEINNTKKNIRLADEILTNGGC